MTITWDIEADNLLADVTKVWCIALKIDNKDTKVYSDSRLPSSVGSIADALELLQQADTLIAHNGMGYDVPVIHKLYDIDLSGKIQLDTLLISKMTFQNIYNYDVVNPNIEPKYYGSYSLKSFGMRFGDHKLDYDDWSKLTEEMLVYCKQDVDLTYRLFEFLKSQKNYPTDRAIVLEASVKWITTLQELYGFTLDVPKAEALRDKLLLEQFTINRKLQKVFRPRFLPVKEEPKPNKTIKRKLYVENNNYIGFLST